MSDRKSAMFSVASCRGRFAQEKFLRLLQLLGDWCKDTLSLILIFVDTQQECDDLYQDLYGAGAVVSSALPLSSTPASRDKQPPGLNKTRFV